jgi:hypothetical protein
MVKTSFIGVQKPLKQRIEGIISLKNNLKNDKIFVVIETPHTLSIDEFSRLQKFLHENNFSSDQIEFLNPFESRYEEIIQQEIESSELTALISEAS